MTDTWGFMRGRTYTHTQQGLHQKELLNLNYQYMSAGKGTHVRKLCEKAPEIFSECKPEADKKMLDDQD